ncbi:HU family DNA-binding protein [Enterococcus sp. AZ103]|uniref:HU family DNA-binding protein n=1 Tax=Enterococcus sp. AZ103 TaxID=2774628 RepID=UPI003F2656DB
MMNKDKLASNVADKTGLTKKDSLAAVNELLTAIEESLAQKEKVQIIGFGNFEVRTRAERKGRNPQTGDEITIPESKVPAFKAGVQLKDAVN